MPRVSVLMSVYNGARYVSAAVESILQQSFRDFEFIIVDDASNDQTPMILAAYARQDRRIHLITNAENLGLTRSLNRGLAQTVGEYIARQDADDISDPDRLAKQVALLDSTPGAVLAFGNYAIIDADNYILSVREKACDPVLVHWYMLFYNYLNVHSLMMVRRENIIKLGGYDETRRYSQDYELWLRLLKQGQAVIHPDVLGQYRDHQESISRQRLTDQEQFSLRDSQKVIAEWIGEIIPLEEIIALRAFWTKPFPDSDFAVIIQRYLQHLYRAFVYRYPLSKTLIRQQIGIRYIYWAGTVERKSIKIKLTLYAFYWYPGGTAKKILNNILKSSFSNL